MKKATFDPTAIRREFDQFARELADSDPNSTPRTWAFELETPDADMVNSALARHYRDQTDELTWLIGESVNPRTYLEFCGDGSVSKYEDGECQCDCASCTEHTCDCEHCDYGNAYPEHDCGYSECDGSGTYQEIKPATYCEGTHPPHLALLDLADIESAEINDTCGLHIHLGSADLNARDVANVIRVYRALTPILDSIAGRAGTYYADRNTESEARRAQFQGLSTEKYRAVNTAPHFSGHRAQTIEFRQHEGTNSTAEIRAWAVLLMQIVEFAKTNRTTLWLAEATTFAEAWRLLTAKR